MATSFMVAPPRQVLAASTWIAHAPILKSSRRSGLVPSPQVLAEAGRALAAITDVANNRTCRIRALFLTDTIYHLPNPIQVLELV